MSGSSTGSGGGAAALRAAATIGDVAACQRYLGTARCVRFSRDEHGRSALHLAASAGHGQVVRLLLNVAAPKEIDSPDGSGCTALQRAAADGHEEVLKLVLARGADVDKQDSVHGNSALHEAAWKGYSRSVRLLAAAGANLHQANAGGFTALHLCCQNGHNQSCRELLLAGCNADTQNNYGDTALHTAARYGHAGVTRILISAQCRVSEQNKNGDTALHIAAAMGRRKLTRILLEANCDKGVRNKQNETARDIALRKDLNEILVILDECGNGKKERKSRKSAGSSAEKSNKSSGRSKSKVRFDPKHSTDAADGARSDKPKHWSPYGCHYYPDPEAFPQPRLDSLPHEPLKRGEQYYLDLAGNICKGPVGVGYTCYCAPLFRHLEARLERDKRELQRAQVRLGQRVAGLEQKLSRGVHGRRSERVMTLREPPLEPQLPRSRSLEMLDKLDDRSAVMQATRSMDELENTNEDDDGKEGRPSVRELVARIQQQQAGHSGNHSESSDDEDGPLRMTQFQGVMGDSNLAINSITPNYENVPNNAPARSRSAVYSPTINAALVESPTNRYIEPIVKIQNPAASRGYYDYYPEPASQKYHHEMSARLAKMRVVDGPTKSSYPSGANRMLDSTKMFESTTRMLENPQDTVDRDTNNDSGYSTKVYGSSKGNSPSLSGQIDNECLGAASLV